MWLVVSATNLDDGSEATNLDDGSALCIIESVDSICRDTTDTQYKLIQKNLSKSL